MNPTKFDLNFDLTVGENFTHTLELGGILFILGANGTGKSSLISQLFNSHHQHAKRISAHRQTWFTSNALDLTPQSRDRLDEEIQHQDRQVNSRYIEEYAEIKIGVTIFDLIDAVANLDRKIANLVRNGKNQEASKEAETPSPLQVTNELLRLSNIPIEISLEDKQKILASRANSSDAPYSIAELSDGERSALLIIAAVLTAKPNTLLLIDEPERHLHRSIISPLLTLLFEQRRDCAFVVSTHEVMLPVDNPNASTLLLRTCRYESAKAKSWKADLLSPGVSVDDTLKRDLLGSREKIIFVEGTTTSLDAPMYSILFPNVSIIPKESCLDVENAVKSLRDNMDLHWVEAWGIVDNDGRSAENVEHLKNNHVYALSHYSVESLYYHPEIVKRVASRQAEVTDDDATNLCNQAVTEAVSAVRDKKTHLISKAVNRRLRREYSESFPSKENIQNKNIIKIEIDIDAIRIAENQQLEKLITNNQFEQLLQHYPLRESGALSKIAQKIGLKRQKYETAVRKLVREDASTRSFLKQFFDDLPSEINTKSDGGRGQKQSGKDSTAAKQSSE